MRADGRFLRFRILLHHPVQGLHEFRAVAVHRHHIGDLRGEAVVDEHLAAAGLVQDRDGNAVAETAGAVRQDQVHVLQDRVVADLVVGDIVGDILDEAVVPDRHVVQGRIMHAGVLLQPAGELELPLEAAETHGAGKAHPLDMVHRPGGRQHVPPVLRFAAGGLQLIDFLLSKIPVFHVR